jgi:hypothetical protein
VPAPTPVAGLNPISRQTLQAGQKIDVPLSVTPATGTAFTLSVVSPIPDVLSATITGTTLTLQASASAVSQGLIPVTVTVTAGTSTATVRVPVEIGTAIQNGYARFNALRAQGNLNPVTFDDNASMNCWLHGRYSLVNTILEHTEDLTLPFSSVDGRTCASTSNIAYATGVPIASQGTVPFVDGLFTAPFHTAGMMRNTQTSVGIGAFARPSVQGNNVFDIGGGITSIGGAPTAGMFPGNGATTDLSTVSLGERPNPLASCSGFDPAVRAGLPLIVMTGTYGDTTASNATVTEDGQPLTVCAYGSTQYTNTIDPPLVYTTGPVSAQDVGRNILKGYGAVFIVPQKPLNPGKTYAVSVNVNGQPISWSFKTSSSLKTQSLNSQGTPVLQ